ncbi:hypothetical protein DFH09DRAFT_1311613 [Mycena vulgaris]|nr:hypothetical protein DFH09DRAFT_1311613 [Mycena vulgaris]
MRAFKTLGDPIHINIILPVESLDPRRGPSLAPSGPGVPPRSCTPSLRSSKDTAERAQAVPHTHGAIFSAAASLAPRPVLSEEDDSGAPSLAPGPIDERRKSAEAVTVDESAQRSRCHLVARARGSRRPVLHIPCARVEDSASDEHGQKELGDVAVAEATARVDDDYPSAFVASALVSSAPTSPAHRRTAWAAASYNMGDLKGSWSTRRRRTHPVPGSRTSPRTGEPAVRGGIGARVEVVLGVWRMRAVEHSWELSDGVYLVLCALGVWGALRIHHTERAPAPKKLDSTTARGRVAPRSPSISTLNPPPSPAQARRGAQPRSSSIVAVAPRPRPPARCIHHPYPNARAAHAAPQRSALRIHRVRLRHVTAV